MLLYFFGKPCVVGEVSSICRKRVRSENMVHPYVYVKSTIDNKISGYNIYIQSRYLHKKLVFGGG